jgi:membrane-associated protease RseP (regulator of RpoE activity)
MYDEITTQSADYQAPKQPEPATPNEFRELEKLVAEVLSIESQGHQHGNGLVLRYTGQLMLESSEAFDHLDGRLEPLGYQAHFTTDDSTEKHVVMLARSLPTPEPRPWWPNAVLLVLTIFSTMLTGALIEGVELGDILPFGLFEGWVYAASLLLILGAHELGHYFAARHHRVAVTLPYFLPMPIPGSFGTLGAFIQLREPMRNRRQLFDIGISGPLAGLIFAIPILMIGVATADVNILPNEENCEELGEECAPYILEGNSVVYKVTKFIFHGKWLPSDFEDMTVNQLSYAGWTGLFVTGLNLIPLGQLDGGHVLYTIIGKRAKQLYAPILLIMAGLVFFVNEGWILLVILMFFFGRIHAVPRNDITPLGPRRRLLGIAILIALFLIFTPSPITFVDPTMP